MTGRDPGYEDARAIFNSMVGVLGTGTVGRTP
jgi:hypothetical protein